MPSLEMRTNLLAAFLLPDLAKTLHAYITIPSALAEISMVVYLLVVGVRTPRSSERVAATPELAA